MVGIDFIKKNNIMIINSVANIIYMFYYIYVCANKYQQLNIEFK